MANIGFVEVLFLGAADPSDGLVEICGNGIDDDNDCDIDCEDSDCAPNISNVYISQQPTCPICDDGILFVYTFDLDYENIEISIDGGDTYITPDGRQQLFTGLSDGSYDVVVRRKSSGCESVWSGNPLLFASPPGNPTSGCFNGDFEDGTFEGWTGGFVTNNNGNPNFNGGTYILPGLQAIIQTSMTGYDEFAGEDIPFSNPSLGTYLVKLGDNSSSRIAQRLTFCFTVDNTTSSFSFDYAVVLEDGNAESGNPHTSAEQPFFQWRYYNQNSGENLDLENNSDNPVKIVGDVNNPFFIVSGNTGWKGWTCEEQNLTAFIGQEICVEFITADCTKGGHFGYAYIDNLCSDGLNLIANIDINTTYCENQNVTAKAIESYGFNQYSWEVCRYLSGNPIQCFYTDIKAGYSIPPFEDILGWFFNEHSPSTPLECNDKFQIKLNLYNDCSSKVTSTKTFDYTCQSNELNYKAIVHCNDLQDIQIEGSHDCDDCDFIWTPSQYLNNSSIPFPTILGSLNTHALSQTYNLSMTNEFGCTYSTEVEIFSAEELMGSIEILIDTINHCEYAAKFIVNFEEGVNFSDYTVRVHVSGEEDYDNFFSEWYEATYIPEESNGFNIVYELPTNFPRGYERRFLVNVQHLSLPEIYNSIGDCNLNQLFIIPPSSPFFGSIDIYVPLSFSPNGNGINDFFGPNFGPNVYEAWLTIWYQSGGPVFSGHAVAPNDGPGLTGLESSLVWDGTHNGMPAAIEEYIWVIDYENCTQPRAGCIIDGNGEITLDQGGCFNSATAPHYGGVQLVR